MPLTCHVYVGVGLPGETTAVWRGRGEGGRRESVSISSPLSLTVTCLLDLWRWCDAMSHPASLTHTFHGKTQPMREETHTLQDNPPVCPQLLFTVLECSYVSEKSWSDTQALECVGRQREIKWVTPHWAQTSIQCLFHVGSTSFHWNNVDSTSVWAVGHQMSRWIHSGPLTPDHLLKHTLISDGATQSWWYTMAVLLGKSCVAIT